MLRLDGTSQVERFDYDPAGKCEPGFRRWLHRPLGAMSVIRVLRVSHSSVVGAWRERDRQLNLLGAEVTLLCAAAWEEGGALVRFEVDEDDFASGVRTFGRHPNLFVFDPRPIWRHLKRHGVDLLDIQEEPFSLAVAEVLLLRFLRRVRSPFVVYSAQNLDKHYPPPFRWIERWVLRHAAGAYVCNIEAGERLVRRGCRGIVEMIPLGVDVALFRPADRAAPTGPLRVGYVGRFAYHKGVHVLLEAIARLEGWTVELVGGGPEREGLEKRVTDLGLEGRVQFIDSSTQTELAARYRTYDVIVVPSLTTTKWTEQFCRVAVEAMASGVPVVASDSGALPEVIGDSGILVPQGDVAALTDALTSISSDPGRWAELRERGLARVDRFRWSTVAELQHHLYDEALG